MAEERRAREILAERRKHRAGYRDYIRNNSPAAPRSEAGSVRSVSTARSGSQRARQRPLALKRDGGTHARFPHCTCLALASVLSLARLTAGACRAGTSAVGAARGGSSSLLSSLDLAGEDFTGGFAAAAAARILPASSGHGGYGGYGGSERGEQDTGTYAGGHGDSSGGMHGRHNQHQHQHQHQAQSAASSASPLLPVSAGGGHRARKSRPAYHGPAESTPYAQQLHRLSPERLERARAAGGWHGRCVVSAAGRGKLAGLFCVPALR